MKYLSLIIVLGLMSFSENEEHAISEFKQIIEVQEQKANVGFQLNMDIQVYNHLAERIQEHQVSTAQKGAVYYSDFGKMRTYTGEQGLFMVNPGVREVYYQPYQLGQYTQSMIEQLDGAATDTSSTLSYADVSERMGKITVSYADRSRDAYKYEIHYFKDTKLISKVRLYSENITQSESNTQPGHMTISYHYGPLETDLLSSYEMLIHELKNREITITQGPLKGYALKS